MNCNKKILQVGAEVLFPGLVVVTTLRLEKVWQAECAANLEGFFWGGVKSSVAMCKLGKPYTCLPSLG